MRNSICPFCDYSRLEKPPEKQDIIFVLKFMDIHWYIWVWMWYALFKAVVSTRTIEGQKNRERVKSICFLFYLLRSFISYHIKVYDNVKAPSPTQKSASWPYGHIYQN